MSATVDSGHGATVVLGTSAWACNIPADSEITWSGVTRDAYETTLMSAAAAASGSVGNRTFGAGRKINPGTLSFPVFLNPDNPPPMRGNEAVETITVTFAASDGDTTGANWAGNCTMTSYAPSNGDPMLAEVEFQLSGAQAFTAGS